MEHFARIVVGYHGCSRSYANALLVGRAAIADLPFEMSIAF
jgi:hypothetical protein